MLKFLLKHINFECYLFRDQIAPPPIPDDVEPITPYKPEAVVNAMKVNIYFIRDVSA